MDYFKLDELMKIEKKSDANKPNKQEFKNQLVNLMKEEGYSEKVEDYLYNGFSFTGAVPFFEYMKSETEHSNIYFKLVKGNRFYNETIISLKIELHLLGLILNEFPSDSNIIQDIIMRLSSLSKNKDGNRYGNLTKSIEKYFLNTLSNAADLPILENLTTNIENIEKFKTMMFEGLKDYYSKNEKFIGIKDKVFIWLDNANSKENNNVEIKTLIISESGNETIIKEQEKTIVNKEMKSEKTQSQNSIQAIPESKLNKFSWYEGIESIKRHVFKQEFIIKEKIDIINRIENEKEDLNKNIDTLKLEMQKLNKNNEETLKKLYESMNENRIYKIEIEDLNGIVNQKTHEIEDRKQLSEMISKDYKKQLEELINRISSKLKVEYTDFKEILDEDMTIDLGENMRLQLISIFEILEKNGMHIK